MAEVPEIVANTPQYLENLKQISKSIVTLVESFDQVSLNKPQNHSFLKKIYDSHKRAEAHRPEESRKFTRTFESRQDEEQYFKQVYGVLMELWEQQK